MALFKSRRARKPEPPSDEYILERYRELVAQLVDDLRGHEETFTHLAGTDSAMHKDALRDLQTVINVQRRLIRRFDFIEGGRWQKLYDALAGRYEPTRH